MDLIPKAKTSVARGMLADVVYGLAITEVPAMDAADAREVAPPLVRAISREADASARERMADALGALRRR